MAETMAQATTSQNTTPNPLTNLRVESVRNDNEAVTASHSSTSIVPEQSMNLTVNNVLDSIASSVASADDTVKEPNKKKLKLDLDTPQNEKSNISKDEKLDKLEQRLGGILCCAVCLDLPKSAIYQCTNGHLMCAGCFTHLLADARLRDEVATCPNCRVEISKHLASRNLAVEKAVSELPAECQFCSKEFPRNTLERHENELCDERISRCMYYRIGCPWRGPFHEMKAHQDFCSHPKKNGSEVMEVLSTFDVEQEKEKKMYSSIFSLLSYEKITFNDLQFKPYRTDEFIHKLFYETSRFSAFNNQWVVKSRINNHQRDPTQSSERQFTYQMILKTKPSAPLDVNFLILKGPFGDIKVTPQLHQYEFSEQNNESPFFNLALADNNEANRLLSSKTIHFR